MPVTALFAASLMVVPNATEQVAKMVMRDNPSRGESGAAVVEVSVDPEGKVYRCEPLHIIGNEAFGAAACKSHPKWRLAEPKDAEGAPSYAVTRNIAVFAPGSSTPEQLLGLRFAPDIRLSVAHGQQVPTENLVLAAAVSEAGRVTHCEVSTDGAPQALVDAACDIARQEGWDVLLNAGGQPVPYVRSVLVRVESQPA